MNIAELKEQIKSINEELTDVENEENGLLTYRRDIKIPLDTIRKINEGTWEG